MPAFSAFSISNFGFGARTTRGYFKPNLPPPPSTIEYVMIAGGGGGGHGPNFNSSGGGGGAGGYIAGVSLPVTYDIQYNVTVGSGGPKGVGGGPSTGPSNQGVNGNNSTLEYGNPGSPAKSTLTATGGGGGGGGAPGESPYRDGKTGGSGGGGSQRDGGGAPGTPGQGNAGASGCNGGGPSNAGNGGGGGGAGAGGAKGLGPADGPTSGYPNPQYPAGAEGFGNGGVGGVGITTTFDGTTRYIGGGGGGGRDLGVPSFGGRNPAPNPSYTYPSSEPHGGAESGGGGGGGKGGGGGGGGGGLNAGNGGGGFVWIRYPSTNMPLAETSGLNSYTDNGTYKIYKWEGAGSFKWYAPGVDPNP